MYALSRRCKETKRDHVSVGVLDVRGSVAGNVGFVERLILTGSEVTALWWHVNTYTGWAKKLDNFGSSYCCNCLR